MIVNRRSKIGVFEKKDLVNEKGLLVLDFNNQEKNYLEDYLDWEVKGLSPNGANLALTTISSHRKSYRTDFVIIERISQRVLLNTHDYYVYDAEFNLKGDKILVVADNKKPFCYDLILNKITAVLPQKIRTYKGDLDLERDVFIAPCEKNNDTCYLFSFNSGKVDVLNLGTKARISRIKFSVDFAHIFVVTEKNILYCFDRKFEIKWKIDFGYLGNQGGRISSSDIFITEDGSLLGVCTSSAETNKWGIEYVVDSADGRIVRQIEGYQFRGRFATDFFDNRVLLHKLKTADLKTGEISENPIF